MPATHPTPAPDPSFVLLQVAPSVDPASIDRRLQDLVRDGGGSLLFPLDDGWYVVSRAPGKELRVVAGGTNQHLADFVATLPGIVGVQIVHAGELVRLYEEHQSKRLDRPAPAAALQVDDWNLKAVRARAAWDMFGGWENIPWGNIRIGHLDTGYTEHPAFGPWQDGRSPSLLPHLGINFFDETDGPRDWLQDGGTPGHGTRTCSVLTGFDPAANFAGVAPHVPVVPYRISNFVVLDTLWWRNQRVGEAIDHAVANTGCAVISISMGDPCAASVMGAAVDRAYERGVIVVAAAGNLTSEVTYPGRYTRAFGIGGITSSDEPWNGGSRGPAVDICAPAELIWRGDWRRESGVPVPIYGNPQANGTSYATVHVSAAAAMWLAHHGSDIDRYRSHPWRIVEAFRVVLASSARQPSTWDDTQFGAGILDIPDLLAHDLPDPETLIKEERLAEPERF